MRKIFIFLLSLLIVISLAGCHNDDQSEEFLRFIEDYMIEELSSDYISLHTSFDNPENYGIDSSQIKVTLGERLTIETMEASRDELNNVKEELNKYNRNKLSGDAKKIYDEFKLSLEQKLALSKEEYMYLDTVFEADTGIHIDMITLFSEWVLKDEDDVKELILLVDDVYGYIDSLLDYTTQQAKLGYMMVDIDSVREYCDGVVEKGKNNSVLLTMKDNIDKLNLENNQYYKEQLEQSFLNSFIPAYKNISDTLYGLKNCKNNLNGFYYLDNGKEYYSYLLKSKVGSDKSVSQIKKMLEKRANLSLLSMQKIYTENENVLNQVEELKTKFKSYYEIMEYLKSCYDEDFPSVGHLSYDINNIDPNVASQGISAYFVLPAIDSKKNMQIKVNTHNNTRNIEDINTYTTIAHEGIPGHMYMYSYIYENCNHLYYKLNSHLAFTEGYATYVEFYSMKYLKDLNKDALDLLYYNNLYSSCIIALSDIGIHYEGWDFKEFCRYLESCGMTTDKDILERQYKQLQSNPASFIPYYVGVVEILNLKDEAQDKLKEKFNDKEFHEVLIQDGSRTFNVIENNIHEYIKEHK